MKIELSCRWKDCRESFTREVEQDALPMGWRKLVITRGSLFDRRNLYSAEVDSYLCPKHVQDLLTLLDPS